MGAYRSRVAERVLYDSEARGEWEGGKTRIQKPIDFQNPVCFAQTAAVNVMLRSNLSQGNLERKGGAGDCLGPDHFRKQLLWQCVMTSLSQLKILEFSALWGQFLCLLASLSQSKIVRAKSPKNMFF